MRCNGGQCLFLLVHSSATLLVRDERVCSGPSPYLDQRGEQDIGLKRGRALQLAAARYAQMRALLLTASLDEQMLRGDASQVTRNRDV